VTFDLDLDLEHTLDACWPGVHRVQVWWRSGHLSARRSDLRKSLQTDRRTDRRRTPRHCISSFLEWAKNVVSAQNAPNPNFTELHPDPVGGACGAGTGHLKPRSGPRTYLVLLSLRSLYGQDQSQGLTSLPQTQLKLMGLVVSCPCSRPFYGSQGLIHYRVGNPKRRWLIAFSSVARKRRMPIESLKYTKRKSAWQS